MGGRAIFSLLRVLGIVAVLIGGLKGGLAAPMTEAERRVALAALGLEGGDLGQRAQAAFGTDRDTGFGSIRLHRGDGEINAILQNVDGARGIGRSFDSTSKSLHYGALSFYRFDSAEERARFLTCASPRLQRQRNLGIGGVANDDYSCNGNGTSLAASGSTTVSGFRRQDGSIGANPPVQACVMYRAVGTRFAVGFSVKLSCAAIGDAGGILAAMEAGARGAIAAAGPALDRQWADVSAPLTARDRAAVASVDTRSNEGLRKAIAQTPLMWVFQPPAWPQAEFGFEDNDYVRLATSVAGPVRLFRSFYPARGVSVSLAVLADAQPAQSDPRIECKRAVLGRYLVILTFRGSMNCQSFGGRAAQDVFDALEAAIKAAVGDLPDAPVRGPGAGDGRSTVPPPETLMPPIDTSRPEPEATAPPQDPDAPPQDGFPETDTPEGLPLTPAELATAAGLAGGAALIGSLMMLGASGIRREEALEALRELMRGQLPADGFAEWRQKYEAMGWRYREENGTAVFDPAEGSRRDDGAVFRNGRWEGGAVPPPSGPVDGDVNARGEVWSSFSGGYVDRRTYDQDMASRADLVRRDAATLKSGQDEDVARLRQTWLDSRRDIAIRQAQIAEAYRLRGRVDGILDRLEADARKAGDLDLDRMNLIWRMRQRASDLALAPDPSGSVQGLLDLGRTAVAQGREGLQATYTYKDALVDTALQTGALAADLVATRGAASAGLASWRGTAAALEKGAGTVEAVVQGIQSGLGSYATGKLIQTGQKAVAEIPAVADLIQKAKQTEVRLWPKSPPGAPASGTRTWGTGMRAVQQEVEARAAAKLPAGHPARAIGTINETLANAGPRYNARLVNPLARLDPSSPTYGRAVEALTKDPRYLTPQARAAADAVRYDLKLRATERALETVYAKNPKLEGTITGLVNTGSHALKGPNYRGLPSDIDFAAGHNGTAAGARAAELFKQEFDGALKQVSRELSETSLGRGNGVSVGTHELKINVYSEAGGRGAFRSAGGLKVKDMMNQTSGSIEKIDGIRVTHRLNGSDPVEVGAGTRWSTGSARDLMSKDPARLAGIRAADARQLADFRADCLNKYAEELGEMTTPGERLHQAAKLYRLTRTMEAKSLEGRPLEAGGELLDLARSIKTAAGGMGGAEQDALAKQLLEAIRSGQ